MRGKNLDLEELQDLHSEVLRIWPWKRSTIRDLFSCNPLYHHLAAFSSYSFKCTFYTLSETLNLYSLNLGVISGASSYQFSLSCISSRKCDKNPIASYCLPSGNFGHVSLTCSKNLTGSTFECWVGRLMIFIRSRKAPKRSSDFWRAFQSWSMRGSLRR